MEIGDICYIYAYIVCETSLSGMGSHNMGGVKC